MNNTFAKENIVVEEFGLLKSGSIVKKYTIRNGNGLKMSVINYGGIITSLETTDTAGNTTDVVLGYDTLEEYVNDRYYLGCIIGRYANRIKQGNFTLQEKNYQLECNEEHNHLHGGNDGFHRAYWEISPIAVDDNPALELTYRSEDGEQGYPGTLDVKVIYILTENALEIRYSATTTQTTIINLTHHTYFNLNSDHSHDILGHDLRIDSTKILELDDTFCPTGTELDIRDSAFDFGSLRRIRMPLNGSTSIQEYDHCYLLDNDGKLKKVAQLRAPDHQVGIEVWTTEPAVQLYTGNHLHEVKGKRSVTYSKYGGICLETQHYPNSPNHAHFPNTVLKPDEVFESTTIYRFV